MKFVDLFAGLGGFHVSLSSLGHECVFACEKDEALRKLYTENFDMECAGDIRQIKSSHVPEHDILCAGFPCQPFSKAGKQKGLEDIGRGDLIYDIFRLLRTHKPQYVILENVPNLRKHDREATWILIESTLRKIGYDVKEAILSPHDFRVPQIRKRIFVVGSFGRKSLKNFTFPSPISNYDLDVRNILDVNPSNAKKLSSKQLECLDLWQQIIDVIPKSDNIRGGLPIWGMEFQATYPFKGKAPYYQNSDELSKYKGAFGISLKGLKKSEQLGLLPSYARYNEKEFPLWKQKYISGIREFLNKYSTKFFGLFDQLSQFPASWQKLEWNCVTSERIILNHLIQFRASGIRIKKTNYTPALTRNSTQIPIIGWECRYITVKEASKLQGLEKIKLPLLQNQAFGALGNAVNVQLATLIARCLLSHVHKKGEIMLASNDNPNNIVIELPQKLERIIAI